MDPTRTHDAGLPPAPAAELGLLRPGETTWRNERADRVAFLVDAAAYFLTFAKAVARARRSILVLAWDVHSRTSLFGGEPPVPWPDTLGEFLSHVVGARRSLHAHVLDWDYYSLYSLEREFLPALKMGWRTHRRVHFALDDGHPPGASHHQKVVVVDDRIAFVGGLDLTVRRWDTPEHGAFDPRRLDHEGVRYPPFHDVMIAVDGDAAAALGQLARERWERATGERLPAPRGGGEDPWPEDLVPDIRDAVVGISRTAPSWRGQPPVREVEQLFLESIAAARRYVFFENQYFTSHRIGAALAARLAEPDGPEVVAVVPRECSGWLEKTTMGELRRRLLERLREQDPFGRFRAYCPTLPGLPEQECMGLHSKVMIVDDRLVRIGSANLSNRSMGLDTECDVAIESSGEKRRADAIAGFRDRLLGEHLGVEPASVARELAASGSLIRTIEALRRPGRSLVSLDSCCEEGLEVVLPGIELADPERPLDAQSLVREILPETTSEQGQAPLVALGLVLLVSVLLALLWRFTELREWLDLDALARWAQPLRASPMGALVGIGGFVLGTLVMLPVTLMFLELAFLFGPILGFAYGMTGALLAAAATFALGRALGKRSVRRLAGSRIGRVGERLGRSGILAVAAVRALPVAPFNVINLVAGAASVRPRTFLAGSALGLLPGAISMTLLGASLEDVVRRPEGGPIALLVGLCIAILLAAAWLRRRVVVRGLALAAAPPREAASD